MSLQVDSTKEAERIKQNKEKNMSPAAGDDTPVIKTKDKGLLGGVYSKGFFGWH